MGLLLMFLVRWPRSTSRVTVQRSKAAWIAKINTNDGNLKGFKGVNALHLQLGATLAG